MADAFAEGKLQPTSALAAQAPWPEAGKTFSPGGFVASETDPSASAPVCAPGFSVLLAPLIAVGGFDAIFIVTPLAGALLVWLAFAAGSAIANPVAGAMAAVLVASSPPMLYQVVQDERRDDGRAVDGDVRGAATPTLRARRTLLRT